MSISLNSSANARRIGGINACSVFGRTEDIPESVPNIVGISNQQVINVDIGEGSKTVRSAMVYYVCTKNYAESPIYDGALFTSNAPFTAENNYLPLYRIRLGSSYYLNIATNTDSNTAITRIFVTNRNVIENQFNVNPKWLDGGSTAQSRSVFFRPLLVDFNGETYVGYCMFDIASPKQGSDIQPISGLGGIIYSLSDIENVFGHADGNEIDEEYGSFSSAGGYSGYNPSGAQSERVGVPPVPPSVSALGFLNVYKVNTNDLQNFINDIFPKVDAPDIPVPTGDGKLAEVVESINTLVDSFASGIAQFSNSLLLKDVLDCHIIPVNCTGTNELIKVGYKETTCVGQRVSSDYVDIDCGTINIKEVYGNYIDYVGTRAKLFLPFVGFVDVKPEYWQNGSLNVKYRFNVINGSFMAWVLASSSKSTLTNSVIGEYSGNACISVPLNGTDYTQVLSGVASAVTSMTSFAQGNVAQGMSGIGNAVTMTKPSQQHNGSYNMSSSFMGMKRPYLIIEREVPSFSKNYAQEQGLPLNATYTLKDLKGFTSIESVKTSGLKCTQTEQDEIIALLKGGVFL